MFGACFIIVLFVRKQLALFCAIATVGVCAATRSPAGVVVPAARATERGATWTESTAKRSSLRRSTPHPFARRRRCIPSLPNMLLGRLSLRLEHAMVMAWLVLPGTQSRRSRSNTSLGTADRCAGVLLRPLRQARSVSTSRAPIIVQAASLTATLSLGGSRARHIVPALKQLLREQLAGRVREAAEAILLFDLKWHVDLRQWRALCHLAAWSTLVPFDEQSRCLSKGAEKRRAHWSETCQRAKGQFIVASIPVRNVSRFGRLPKDARGTCPYLRTTGRGRLHRAAVGGRGGRLGESLGPHAQRIAICVTGFEHAFGEIEANVQAAIETLATNHRRLHVFGVVPRNASWAQVERMLARKGWRDDATIEAQQPRGSLTAPFNFWPQRKGRSFMLELHDCAQCERMMADREQAGGFTFDVVVRLRLDTYFEVPLSGVPAAIADDELHVPFMSRCGGVNDKFAVGGRGAMRAYLTRLRRLGVADHVAEELPFGGPSHGGAQARARHQAPAAPRLGVLQGAIAAPVRLRLHVD